MLHTRQPQTEDALSAMRVRNEARAAIVMRAMGTKYACHPMNRVPRKNLVPDAVTLGREVQKTMARIGLRLPA